jgi:hypothetical protein
MRQRLGPLCLMALLFSPAAILADGRAFTFIYEARPAEPGEVEVENWATFQTGTEDRRFSQADFRHELEFGVTKQLQLGFYVADWNYHTGFADRSDGFAYTSTAAEAIYNLADPATHPLGISLYQEVRGGDRLFESESKIILQKNFGPIIAAYNATLEAAWEGHGLNEHRGEFQQALGLSREFSHTLSAGIEMLHEVVFPDWSAGRAANNFFIGPNISVRRGECYVTLTVLAQATRTEGEPDMQVRTIFGFEF